MIEPDPNSQGDPMINQLNENIKIAEEDLILQKSMRYEYYIHYKGLDRRNERWVTEHFIRVDDQEEIKK